MYYVFAACVIAGLIALGIFLLNGKQIDVLNPSGEVAGHQRSILLFTVGLSAMVVVPVFTMLIYFSVKYRAGNKNAKYTPDWGENKILESLWWGIPILIIGVLGVITYQTSHSLDPYKSLAGDDELKVQVVALQWKWLFIYPEQNVASLNYLPIPVDTPIKFVMTADAPMSAFWIPALGSQIYAMNSMESQLHLKALKVGEYKGYTTNINGEGYSKMTFMTKAMERIDFDSWVKEATESKVAMNSSTYEQLSNKTSETDERTYRLADPGLYKSIVNKYGGHNHGTHGGHE